MTNRFAGTPDEVDEGAALSIQFCNPDLANTTVTVTATGDTEEEVEITIALDADGKGTATFTPPLDWTAFGLSHPTSIPPHSVDINLQG